MAPGKETALSGLVGAACFGSVPSLRAPPTQSASQPRSADILVLGGIAAAATAGALVGFGHRLGDVALPFAATGGVLVRASTAGIGAPLVVGIILTALAAYCWSGLFLWLAGSVHRTQGVRTAPGASAMDRNGPMRAIEIPE